jgi:hypothetical protein
MEVGMPGSCAVCGRSTSKVPLSWALEVDSGGFAERQLALSQLAEKQLADIEQRRRWICDRCARDHLRSIEAKFDREWW